VWLPSYNGQPPRRRLLPASAERSDEQRTDAKKVETGNANGTGRRRRADDRTFRPGRHVTARTPGPRPPFRNNARAVLAATLGALVVFVAVQVLIRKSRDFSPDFLASVLLYGLTVLNITLLLVLVFVLGRNLVRVVMERRRRVLGARLRMRLAIVFVLMAAAPATLLILVGSDLIQQTVDRWFNVDVERILSSLQILGSAVRNGNLERTRTGAEVLAREIEGRRLLDPAGQARLRRVLETRARELKIDVVDVFTREGEVLAVANPRLSTPEAASAGEDLAQAALSGRGSEATVPFAGGELARIAVPIHGADGVIVGAIVASTFSPVAVAAEIREVQERYTKYRKTESFKGPIKAVYLSLYLFPALLILFGAVWMSLYLARRITTPLRLVAEGAERIASGERGVRVDFPSGDDEFTALIASFNRMSERLARSEEEVEHTRAGLTRKNAELEDRRRLMETVLETVGTGVVVVDAEGTTTAINAAACRLLDVEGDVVSRPLPEALKGPGREEILSLVQRLLSGRGARQEREVTLPAKGRDRHLAVTVVPLPGAPGSPPGAVVVLDDLTPLMRAQKVAAWGEVARKLAHEIKNPLTPIQLSAQRIRKAYLKGAPDLEKVVQECTGAIVQEVEALKNLVDEFAQFARLPAANLAPASLHEVIEETLTLYDGLFTEIRVERRLGADVPTLRLDADQMKRVLINLVDNAIEATDKKGTVTISTEFDRSQGRVRLGVADDGPGIPAEARDKLFVPHFSTKKRGSGLGLAIVSRIIQEHHGLIRIEDNRPHGARFVVELPA
jgi:two-component system nitrogen regulation sensor histidine kinase NtrY